MSSCPRCVRHSSDIVSYAIPVGFGGLDKTNLYIVRGGSEAAIIDLGVPSPHAWGTFQQVMVAENLDPAHTRLILTHLHIDHAGLVRRATEPTKSGRDFNTRFRPFTHIVLGQKAYDMSMWTKQKKGHDETIERLSREGINLRWAKWAPTISIESRACNLSGRKYELACDGDIINVGSKQLKILETPGHTHGDISIIDLDSNMVMCGDTVLEYVNPGVAFPYEGTNPLKSYWNSIAKIEHVHPSLVLPGHGSAFADLESVLTRIRARHAARLGDAYEIIADKPGIKGEEVLFAMRWGRRALNPEKLHRLRAVAIVNCGLSSLECLVQMGEIAREFDGNLYRYFVK